MRSLRHLLVATLVLAASAACTASSAPTPGPPSTTAPPACQVPAVGADIPTDGTLFGVNLDWGSRTLDEYAGDLGRRPAVAVSFASVPFAGKDREYVLAAGDQVRANGGTLLLTFEPHQGLAAVTEAVAADVAATVATITATGVPVIVRFAHEMNGSWYAWGQQPTAYQAAFRRMADAVHRGAAGAAMMWAPNNANGYPFAGGPHSVHPGTADFAAADVDGDGTMSLADDPYAPYYPGDDVVDWVGMSLYHWGSTYPWGENELPEDGKFAAQLTGTYLGAAGDERAAPDFYQEYSVGHGKPLAIPETAAFVVPSGDATGELAIKQAWWRQVLSDDTHARFPQLKMINWFEWDKQEPEARARVDWTATTDEAVRTAFLSDLPDWLKFAAAPTPCQPPGTS